jgi:hypothetical protein
MNMTMDMFRMEHNLETMTILIVMKDIRYILPRGFYEESKNLAPVGKPPSVRDSVATSDENSSTCQKKQIASQSHHEAYDQRSP